VVKDLTYYKEKHRCFISQ